MLWKATTKRYVFFAKFWDRNRFLVSPNTIFASSKGIQDSLGFWIPRQGFRIPGTGFQSLSVELEFWIPIVSGFRIPWAVFRIPKPRIPDYTSKNFPDSGIQFPYTVYCLISNRGELGISPSIIG